MFSLIISIISIALVAALAAATVYFGGAAFNKGSAGADASAFINAGQQIAGAFTLAAADGYTVPVVADLQDGSLGESSSGANDGDVYLSQVPTYKGDTLVEAGNFVAVVVSDQVCQEIVDRSKGKGTAIGSLADADAITDSTDLYNCGQASADIASVSAAANEHVAYYKVK